MPYRILLRRDTSTNWDYNNPVLMLGEPGFESNTGRLKIGDGQSPWKDLDYTLGNTGPAGENGPTGAMGATGDSGVTGPTGISNIYTVDQIGGSQGFLDFSKVYNGVSYTGGTCGLTLPIATSGDEGKFLIIADESGSISTYGRGIYVTADGGQSIDGNPYVLMKTNYMSLTLIYANSNWKII